ncbi:MAG: ABC transporter permease [Christensenellales bacterium]|jgi:putative ABC transport system permease protein|nr:ABC transporter permease [Clostridia bacterium]HRU84796.1 ABC transporter permease [Eubacteriales bacterium]
MLKEIILMSFKNLRTNTLRTALSILGVLIGIASIIALMTLGRGVTSSVTDQLTGLGGNRITIEIRQSTAGSIKKGFTDEEIEQFADLQYVASVSPTLVKPGARVITNDPRSAQTGGYSTVASVLGTSQYFFAPANQIQVKYGRGITESDVTGKNNACVLGSEIAYKMFGNTNPRGAIIYIDNYEFMVWDVVEKISGPNENYNSFIFIPYTTARDRLLFGEITQLVIEVSDTDKVSSVFGNAEDLLLEIFNNNPTYFKIKNEKVIMDMVVTITDLIIGMLGGIASIALLVGGIGIMNMMLVTVRERTSEIGLRLALGAKPGLILLQFLIEAVIISLIGGIAGVAVGIFIAYVACNIIGASFILSASTVLLSVGFSIAVGLIFGLLPARKASRLNPIDALKAV